MDDVNRDLVRTLIKEAGYATDNLSWSRLSGGRNNRTYRVDTPDGPVLLKQYYRDGDWDRQAAESRFLLFCEKQGMRSVPRLLTEAPTVGVALHSWIDGKKPAPGSITEHDIQSAMIFLDELKGISRECEMSPIPPARDAALCLEDFFRSPRERLEQLRAAILANPDGPMISEVRVFYERELFPVWEQVSAAAYSELSGRDQARLFLVEELFVSPSDIGFHNALRLDNGGMAFLDFEYAGLDSPLKAWGDFVCQADYHISIERVNPFLPSGKIELLKTLLPLFRIKFCCILLNEFKAIERQKREFALSGIPEVTARYLRRQLQKARMALYV